MSEVIQSAGEPGTARCSDAESGSTPSALRMRCALEASWEIADAVPLLRQLTQGHTSSTMRGLLLRVEQLAVAIMTAIDDDGTDDAAIERMVFGDRLQAKQSAAPEGAAQ